VSCAAVKLVNDPAPDTIGVGHKRVETEICGRHEVGENGCVFPRGELTGVLKIRRVLQGNLSIVGQGCKVDWAQRYEWDKNPWIELDLRQLVGNNLTDDCVLDIYQFVDYPGSATAPFQIHGIYGTVTLGTCPDGIMCRFESEQLRAGWHPDAMTFSDLEAGQYLLRGCNSQVVPPTAYTGPLSLNLEQLWPHGYPSQGKTGCLFILGVRGDNGALYKVYRKVWLFKEEALRLDAPSLTLNPKTGKIRFVGDNRSSLSTTDTNIFNGNSGDFIPAPDGNWLRFYTVKGRTLVVLVKNGSIVWQR